MDLQQMEALLTMLRDNDVTEFRKDGTPTGASFVPQGSTDGDGLAYDPTTDSLYSAAVDGSVVRWDVSALL